MSSSEHSKKVAGLFDSIAGWYDFLNHFLSFGMDIHWRAQMVKVLGKRDVILDLAAGTLDVSIAARKKYPDCRVIGADYTAAMLRKGQAKLERRGIRGILPVQADGRKIPLPDASVDAVTIAFGIRNIIPRHQAFDEIFRVLKPGGKLAVLEFGTGQRRIWNGLYNFYLSRILPLIGQIFSKDRQAYKYLADTIRSFPAEDALAAEIESAGFESVAYRGMCSGVVFLHTGEKSG